MLTGNNVNGLHEPLLDATNGAAQKKQEQQQQRLHIPLSPSSSIASSIATSFKSVVPPLSLWWVHDLLHGVLNRLQLCDPKPFFKACMSNEAWFATNKGLIKHHTSSCRPLVVLIFFEVSGGPFGTEVRVQAWYMCVTFT
eukprot:804815-Pelagomonas_calceolata.AAC.9